MLTTLLITVIIALVCVALLSVSILFKRNGTFPSTHIEGNEALRKRGIRCAKSQHYEQLYRKNLEERLKEI
ncbi:MAG: hypothetical protein LBQ73_05150 [Tannerellaceae bacterium]|jgi:hypothetical protein|nr:hypothetical protein [Tannerellaceae bacterium]